MRIRQFGDPILREVSMPVATSELNSSTIVELIRRMKQILDGIKSISNENGNALSAPQVGQLRRIIVLRVDNKLEAMINPKFTPLSDRTFDFDEECFSAYALRATLARFHDVELSYWDEFGNQKKRVFNGEYAGLVQHEIDHLDGILFVDRVEQAGGRVESIEKLFSDQPARLAKVKSMINYMSG